MAFSSVRIGDHVGPYPCHWRRMPKHWLPVVAIVVLYACDSGPEPVARQFAEATIAGDHVRWRGMLTDDDQAALVEWERAKARQDPSEDTPHVTLDS